MTKYYRIKEFSKLTSVTRRALRLYDNMGLLQPSHKTIKNHRLYTQDDMFRLQQIITLRYIGFSLEEIRKIIVEPGFNIENSLKTQSILIEEKAARLENAARLLTSLAKQVESKTDIDWPRLANIIQVMQMDEASKEKWYETYLSQLELLEFEKVAKQKTDEYWKKYTEKWITLYKEVEENLHTDPESQIGMKFARRWLALVDEVYYNFPSLRSKLWEGYKAGIIPANGMPYNKALIEYIEKATTKYKKIRVINLNY